MFEKSGWMEGWILNINIGCWLYGLNPVQLEKIGFDIPFDLPRMGHHIPFVAVLLEDIRTHGSGFQGLAEWPVADLQTLLLHNSLVNDMHPPHTGVRTRLSSINALVMNTLLQIP
jgi:hypothetical protein